MPNLQRRVVPGRVWIGSDGDDDVQRVLHGTFTVPALNLTARAQQLPADESYEQGTYLAAVRDGAADDLYFSNHRIAYVAGTFSHLHAVRPPDI